MVKTSTFFDNSLVLIGTYDGISIQKFVDSNKEECSFWEYSRVMKKKSYLLKIYLLTTFLDPDKYKGNKVTKESTKYKKTLKDVSLCNTRIENNDHLMGTVSNDQSFRDFDKDIDSTNNFDNLKSIPSSSLSILKKNTKNLEIDLTTDIENYEAFDNQKSVPSRSLSLSTKNVEKRALDDDKSIPSPPFSLLTNNKEKRALDDEKSIPSPVFSLLTRNKENRSLNEQSIPAPPFSLLTSLKINNLPSQKQKDLDNDKKQGTDLAFKKPSVVVSNKIDKLKLSIPIVDQKDIDLSEEVIGEGGQGVVFKGKFLGTDVAVKFLQKGKRENTIFKEIKLLEKLRHPNIITIMAVSSTRSQIYIVMEFFASYSLQEVIFNPVIKNKLLLNDLKKNKIAYELCCAIAYLHLQKIPVIHRDIKPVNILVNSQCVTKLCDLGLGKCYNLNGSLQSTIQGRFCGTMLYMAPEVFLGSKEATVNCDIWSLACTLTELYSESEIWGFTYTIFLHSLIKERLEKKMTPSTNDIPDHLKKFNNVPIMNRQKDQISQYYLTYSN